MTSISIHTSQSEYQVNVNQFIDISLFEKNPSQYIFITNKTINQLLLNKLDRELYQLQEKYKVLLLNDGESFKNWDSLNAIHTYLLENRCDRGTILVALGGGVIGDITGFAAATYMRGIRYIQIPTTLLAMVDSSVGGKTGINHPLGKNMIGAFHQPMAVYADVSTLDTLPDRELRCGISEIIKHACIADTEYFAWLERNIDKLLSRNRPALIHAIKRSVEIKASVVQADEKEQGIRAILNFGHTFAHAIEAGLGFGVWLHGEAVGAGLVAASALSHQLSRLSLQDKQRIHQLVQRAGLPTHLPRLPLSSPTQTQADRYLELMRIDKKSAGGNIRYILLNRLGQAEATPCDDSVVAKLIEDHIG